MTLNWRRKAGLFLTLVAEGCGLSLDVSAKQAVGIGLLGIAFSWLVGSLTPRTLGVAFAVSVCALGLWVAISPVWSDWNYTQKSAAEYDVAISDLQAAVKNAGAIPTKAAPTRTIPIPNGAKVGGQHPLMPQATERP
jgi:hypothetical protein